MSDNKSNNRPQQNQRPPMMGGGHRRGHGMMGVKEKPKAAKQTLLRVFSYIASFKFLFISLIAIVIINTLSTLSSNVMIKNVIASLGEFDADKYIFTVAPDFDSFMFFAILLLALNVLHCVLQYLSSLIGTYLSTKMVRRLRNDLFAKIVKLPISYIDTHSHGDLMSRMTNDVDNVSHAISSSIVSLVSGVLTLLGCLGIMIWYSPLLTLVSFVVLFITLGITRLMGKYMRPMFGKQQAILGKLNSQTEEMVTGCKTVIAYNHQMKAIEDFNKESEELTRVGIKAQIIGGSMGPVMNFISNFGYFLVCLFGALFILKGIGNTLLGKPLDVAIVIMFLTTTKQFTRPINEIANLYSSILSALAGAERVFSILDEEVEDFSKEYDFDVNTIKGDIDFKHIEFAYVPGKTVLKDFNVDIWSGHKIALVGATGSGKTTIVNLLLRFYDINSGQITIDGFDIAKISKKDLRSAISIVLQDPVLFGDTIENNIRYGRSDATDEEIDQALEFANCMEFVKHLPEGKKTVLTEGATNISQGQRQLLTIARAVIANPKILILDEATSSVDTRTEKHIQDAMTKLMADRTSIIIAHRLSTIQDADLIVVLDGGVVVEMGNHNELIAIDGVYNRLYQTQFKGLET